MPADDIDFMDSESWTPDIHDRLQQLRETSPVAWSAKTRAHIVSGYEEVSAISRNQAVFTSGLGVRRSTNDVRIGLIDEPEPRHGELRRLISRGFTPRMVRNLEGVFTAITDEFVTPVLDAGGPDGGEFDMVRDVAVPLPLVLIAEMIGIRPEDRTQFHAWSDALIAADGNYDRPEILDRATMAFVEYADYVTEIIEARRREPRDDLVSILVGAKDSGLLVERDPDAADVDEDVEMANDELIMFMVLLLVAGNETTRNAMSGGMQLLVEHPEQCRRLAEDPSLMETAVDEMLRLVSPVHSFTRTVTEDTVFAGVEMRQGEDVLLVYPSANRDVRQFEEPDVFRIDRGGQHLAFGIGPHYCLGASLARMEMRVLFTRLISEMTNLRYAGDGPVIEPSALVRNCTELRIAYDRR